MLIKLMDNMILWLVIAVIVFFVFVLGINAIVYFSSYSNELEFLKKLEKIRDTLSSWFFGDE